MANEEYFDPAVEYAAKPKDEKESAKPLTGGDVAGIIFFFVLWAAYAGFIIWAANDAGWNIVLAILAGVVGGLIATVLTYVLSDLGVYFF